VCWIVDGLVCYAPSSRLLLGVGDGFFGKAMILAICQFVVLAGIGFVEFRVSLFLVGCGFVFLRRV
jgi:hypothetical protein